MIRQAEGEHVYDSLRVTDRPACDILRYAQLGKADLLRIPINGNLLEVGSGLHFKLAAEVHRLRPDVTVYLMDPSLGLSPVRPDCRIEQGRMDGYSFALYRTNTQPNANESLWFEKFQRIRQANAARYGVSLPVFVQDMAASNLPKADIIIDIYGAALYLNGRELINYIGSLGGIMQPGSKAHLYPLGIYGYVKEDRSESIFAQIQHMLKGNSSLIGMPYFKSGAVGLHLLKDA